jgi:hypothetical protein
MNITSFHNYNNSTNDENPKIIEGIGYVAIALLIIVIMICCYLKPNDYVDDKKRIERAKTRLAYRYGGSKV